MKQIRSAVTLTAGTSRTTQLFDVFGEQNTPPPIKICPSTVLDYLIRSTEIFGAGLSEQMNPIAWFILDEIVIVNPFTSDEDE